mmetsp:Transcript_10817/g.14852  ORF Transcript_10817/g.14852 Transcript_10817/m.14852 type:complete len:211 (+) Transcript_10817:501-1133(+)
MVPVNSIGSCGIIHSLLRRADKPISKILTPSIRIFDPATGSTRRKKQLTKLLLPAPVRPTIPIFSLPLIVQDMPFSTRLTLSRYLSAKFSMTMLQSVGQLEGGSLSVSGAASDSSLMYSLTLSTLLMERLSSESWKTVQFKLMVTPSVYVNDSPAMAGGEKLFTSAVIKSTIAEIISKRRDSHLFMTKFQYPTWVLWSTAGMNLVSSQAS